MTNEEFFEKRSSAINDFLNKPLIDKDYLSEKEKKIYDGFIKVFFYSFFENDDELKNHIDSDGKYYGVYDFIDVATFETNLAGFILGLRNRPACLHLQAIAAKCLVDLQTLESEFFTLDEDNGWYEWYDDNVKKAE